MPAQFPSAARNAESPFDAESPQTTSGLVPGVLGDTHFFERGWDARCQPMYKQQTSR
jgi:hypothetical protein